ncbi:MAG TPA: hypothetical protein GXX34_05035 [Clostridia bacterium]|nr:hypothetical protein [Clostridia bacterium]
MIEGKSVRSYLTGGFVFCTRKNVGKDVYEIIRAGKLYIKGEYRSVEAVTPEQFFENLLTDQANHNII